MKHMLSAFLVLSLFAIWPVVQAQAFHHARFRAPYLAPVGPANSNIFGPVRSGVAPPTAIPEREPVTVLPSPNGSRTGGVKD